jgi:hypothetical protein
MKWLQDNPLGMILAGTSGVFALLALGMAIVWNLPVSVDAEEGGSDATPASQVSLAAREIGDLTEYEVVKEKPVFNESRRPVLDEIDDELQIDDDTIEIRGAPDVRLTGVVISPGMRIASLTPADGNLETVMAHEGDSLTGDFVGWQVTVVNPRTVTLESRDGQSLELDLQVHDVKIQEPPKPAAAAAPVALTASADGAGEHSDDDGEEPLSRAEQIRQRIAERREELRLEQEAQQSPSQRQPQNRTQIAAPGQATTPSDYQKAIRAMMKNKSKDQGSNDKNDG